MRVLLLSQWYPPEPDLKVHVLAKALAARGHAVTVVTGFPNYPSGRLYPGSRIRWRQWEKEDGVSVLRVPLYPDHSYSVLRRSLNYLSFACSASLVGSALCGPADVMWVYHPPLTVAAPACWISLLRRVPFVYEIQDMWPESLAAAGVMSSRPTMALLGRLAQLVYSRASAITVISPGFKRNLVAKGVAPEKIHVIPNWADEEVYHPAAREHELGQRHGLVGRFNVIFAGNMGPAQALRTVLQAAGLLNDTPEIQFVLIGDGIDLPALKTEAQRRGLTNVRFIGRQPAAEMPRFFAWADALLVHLRDDPLFRITIPSKTLAYMACGRPVLCAVEGDCADVVREAGAGVLCPPEDPEALAEAVRSLYAMSSERREAMGRSGRETFLRRFSRRVLVDRYEALLSQVAESRRRGNDG